MSLLYDVYKHPAKGDWGVCVAGQAVHAVTLSGQSFKTETLASHSLSSEIAKRIRMGYKKTARPKYLKVVEGPAGKLIGSLVEQHPELDVEGGVVLFTTLSQSDDLLALSHQWEELVAKTDARPEQIESWVKAVQGATQYIVAPASHPAIALVLADWAIENKRLLLAGAHGIPMQVPKKVPKEWENWLAGFSIPKAKIQTALEQLGWSLRDILVGSHEHKETKSDEGNTWLTAASSFNF
jgi:hypothetical protein